MSSPAPVPGTLYNCWGGAYTLMWCRSLTEHGVSAAVVATEIARARTRNDAVAAEGKGIIRVDGVCVPDVPDPTMPERSPVWFVPLPIKEK